MFAMREVALGQLQAGLDWRARRSLFLGALLGLGISSYLSAKDSVSIDGRRHLVVGLARASPAPVLYLAANVTFDVRL